LLNIRKRLFSFDGANGIRQRSLLVDGANGLRIAAADGIDFAG
jgi:hypothetical protein